MVLTTSGRGGFSGLFHDHGQQCDGAACMQAGGNLREFGGKESEFPFEWVW